MSDAIPPLLNTPSWRGVQFKKSTGTTLSFTLSPEFVFGYLRQMVLI
jgi:hypothetical protein